ncbi:RHS domain-containing protein [Kitasatospora sp. NA04385]|nr:RHS domain-containing protein [Kitasatospora sp. NA04385]
MADLVGAPVELVTTDGQVVWSAEADLWRCTGSTRSAWPRSSRPA